MGMILRIASSRIVGQGDIVGRSGYFSLNLSANSVMRGRLDARRTLKSLVADLRKTKNWGRESRPQLFLIACRLVSNQIFYNFNPRTHMGCRSRRCTSSYIIFLCLILTINSAFSLILTTNISISANRFIKS